MRLSNPFQTRQKCFCAFCSSPKKVYKKKHTTPFNWLVLALCASVLTQLFWSTWDGRGLIIFGLMLFGMDIFIHARWRMSLKCLECGFDPLTYQKSPERAASEVTLYMEKRKNNPYFMMKTPLNLPHRLATHESNKPNPSKVGLSKVSANSATDAKAGASAPIEARP